MITKDDKMDYPDVSPDAETFGYPLHDPELMSEERELYSVAGTPQMLALSAGIRRHAADIVNQFYQGLARLPATKRILEILTEPEIQHFKSRQIQQLCMLSAPDLTAAAHCAIALKTGRTRAIIGLNREDLVRARGILSKAIFTRIDRAEHAGTVCLLSRRMSHDLAWQAEAYQRLQVLRQEALQHITQLAWKTESYTDLISQVVQTLCGHPEIAGCCVGRPDNQGVFRVESAAGSTIGQYLAVMDRTAPIVFGNSARDRGPAGRAWNSGEVARCVNIVSDPGMAPWRAAALQAGFHSSLAIPLRQPGGPTGAAAILNLYSPFPGGFTGADQIAFISLLQTVLGFAIARIGSVAGSMGTVPYAVRQRWSALVRSDALKIYYQPILELRTGKVAKVEALARLQDGNRLLTPAEFFPALSSEDFLALYTQGLNRALSQRKLWLRAGIDLNVSVNLPPSALADSRYFKVTRRALAESGALPGSLTLEVLETDAFPLAVDVSHELREFRKLGVQLAEDDLGSGHSSLTRLRELPFDLVKIDRNIVSAADRAPLDTLRFTYQLIQLGHSLRKSVIVEGIENDGILEAVAILGADMAQGYGIARPMAADQLTEWMGRLPDLPNFQAPRTSLGKMAMQLIREELLRLT